MTTKATPEVTARVSRIGRAGRLLWRLAADRAFRNVMWTAWRRPKGAFQPFNTTAMQRYPRIFAFVQSALGPDSAPTILSFGCSTGEEVQSLRQRFPRARIKGIDINPGNIAVCRARLAQAPDALIDFAVADSTAGEPDARYDAIFCMAVLRHAALVPADVLRCDHIIRFEDFAATVADFARCLKPGGLFVIAHSIFRFTDAPASADFETVLRLNLGARAVPQFGPDNRRLPPPDVVDVVFRKRVLE